MAKIKFGMMMTDARGKLGGQVFSKNRAGAYIRTKVTPVNPQSVAQSRVRGNLGALSNLWNTITSAERNTWNAAVDDWQSTDIFGDIKKPSGKNLFTKLNVNLLNSAQSPITSAPEKTALPIMYDSSATFSTASDALTIAFTSSTFVGKLQVEATPMLNNGVSFVKNRFRVIGYYTPVPGTPLDVTAGYVAKFGAMEPNANVHVRFRIIADQGQASTPIALKVETVA